MTPLDPPFSKGGININTVIFIIMPPFEKGGHIALHLSVGMSVGMSVGRYVGSP